MICRRCKKDKAITDFPFKGGKYQEECKVCTSVQKQGRIERKRLAELKESMKVRDPSANAFNWRVFVQPIEGRNV